MATPSIPAIIGRGQANWHATYHACVTTYADGTTSTTTGSGSGAVTPDGYAKDAPDGTPVYDASGADSDAFVSHVYGGPMVSTRLPAGTVATDSDGERRWPDSKVITGATTIEAIREALGYSAMAYCAVDVQITMLRAIPGVRFGTVQRGAVVWEQSNAS